MEKSTDNVHFKHMDQEQTLKDILEIVKFTQDNMVTKVDLEVRLTEVKTEIRANLMSDIRRDFPTKNDLAQLKIDLMTHMDGFIGLHQKLDLELVALRAKYERLESYIEQLASHAQVTLRD